MTPVGRAKQVGAVLLVEDDAGDRMLTEKFFKSRDSELNLYWVEDGEEAMLFLTHKGRFVDMPRPDLILLDLNLPKKDGHEVLAEIRAHPNLSILPIIIFSTSKAPADIRKSYDLGANAFVSKPGDLAKFRLAIEAIYDFWFITVQLPKVKVN